MEEKELFEDYEAPKWEFTSRINKFLGVAIIANILGIFALGQFNVFTSRGCDTAIGGVFCQVLDSAYVVSSFLGEDKEWASTPYAKTELGEAEITYIDVSNQLKYPDGYFALANKDEIAQNQVVPNIMDEFNSPTNPFAPSSATPNSSGDLTNNIQVLPTPNDKVGNQEVPTEPWSVGGDSPTKSPAKSPTIAKNKPFKYPTPSKSTNKTLSNESPKDLKLGGDTVAGGKPKTTPTPKVEPTPAPTVNPADANAEFTKTFNKAPLQDFANDVIAKVDEKDATKKVDLKQNFTVVLDGVLTKDGKFDAKKTKFVKGEGQEQMVNVAKKAIEAIGDSSIFSYLQGLGVEKINLTLVQDDKQLTAVISSILPNESKARTVSSGFNGLMAIAKINVKEPEVQTLISALKFQPQGKSFIINFAMPKDEAHKLIDQKLQEARQKKLKDGSEDSKESATAKTK